MVCIKIEDARTAISFELENMDIRPEQEPLLLEMIHAVTINGSYYYLLLALLIVFIPGGISGQYSRISQNMSARKRVGD